MKPHLNVWTHLGEYFKCSITNFIFSWNFHSGSNKSGVLQHQFSPVKRTQGVMKHVRAIKFRSLILTKFLTSLW